MVAPCGNPGHGLSTAVDCLQQHRTQQAELNPTSGVETADDADDADKQKVGGETGRMSPKPVESLWLRVEREIRGSYSGFRD